MKFRFVNTQALKTKQEMLEWTVCFPHSKTAAELCKWFRRHGVSVLEGRCTLYLPPQSRLREIVPEIVKFYPQNAGFKILRDFRHPNEAQYLFGDANLWVRNRISGKPRDQVVTANYMYSLGIGPRIWDVCIWYDGGISYTVFVVDHVSGKIPTESQYAHFLEYLKKTCHRSQLRVLLPNWERCSDFMPTSCNNNLIESPKYPMPQYVDFQNFGITNATTWTRDILSDAKDVFHFGCGRTLRGSKYPYQSIPLVPAAGKRNTEKRWDSIIGLLSRHAIDLKNRLVLDIGCNAGMMMHLSLSMGASWALGWDRPEVVRYAQEVMFSLGSSRFSFFAAELDSAYDIKRDIPSRYIDSLDEAIIFYLAMYDHIGIIHSLRTMPWRALVYEGHESDSWVDALRNLDSLLDRSDSIWSSIADGDCGERPLVLIVRQ